MKHVRTLHAAATATVILSLAMGILAGCGGGGQDVDPEAVLKESSAAMKEIQGFHFVYDVHKPGNAKPGPGLEIVRITGDVNAEGDMQATIDVTQGGLPLTLDFVQVGDTQYLKILGKWQTIPIEQSPVGRLSLSAGTIQILDQITNATYEGEDKKGGVNCYHISGTVAATEVAAIVSAVETSNPFPTDIWIGVEDSYVYEVDLHGPATASEPEGIWRSIVLSNLNVYVDIKPPI
jgi:LppX_LprAFG lipoprotein